MPQRFAVACGLLLLMANSCIGQGQCQERFKSGQYKGLLSCTAFQYVELEKPLTVREAKGVVTIPNTHEGIPNVIVEFRDSAGQILATKTDSHGRFRIKHLGEGTYKFKTTLSGFPSVMGTVILKMQVDHPDVISIEMPLGV